MTRKKSAKISRLSLTLDASTLLITHLMELKETDKSEKKLFIVF
jgi:hypothetical protein